MSDAKAKEYLRTFKPQKKADLREKFPGASCEALDFLNRTLVFDPKKRLSIAEALEHPFLRGIRDASSEKVGEPVFMGFETEEHIGVESLRELFLSQLRAPGDSSLSSLSSPSSFS